MPRSLLCWVVSLASFVLLGTVLVLSTAVAYFGVDTHDVITQHEMQRHQQVAAAAAIYDNSNSLSTSSSPSPAPASNTTTTTSFEDLVLLDKFSLAAAAEEEEEDAPRRRIPKLIHQTWKVAQLPEKWEAIRQECRAMHPDYQFKLWTDESARDFIAARYPWYLATFDGYPYAIQRADAIRYFVLHHYGGIYLDMDVGCKRRLDPLLYFGVVLPATIPVGLSNDVLVAEQGHPFMDLVIGNLITFDHQYGTNYPTVMFSTGPMFLSAQYGMWPKRNRDGSRSDVRVLPRRWYGKNAPLEESAESYFVHYYGSSWHSDDAALITWLGVFGSKVMWIASLLILAGAVKLFWAKAGSKQVMYSHMRTTTLPLYLSDDLALLRSPNLLPAESICTSASSFRRCISNPTVWLRRTTSSERVQATTTSKHDWSEKDDYYRALPTSPSPPSFSSASSSSTCSSHSSRSSSPPPASRLLSPSLASTLFSFPSSRRPSRSTSPPHPSAASSSYTRTTTEVDPSALFSSSAASSLLANDLTRSFAAAGLLRSTNLGRIRRRMYDSESDLEEEESLEGAASISGSRRPSLEN